MKDNLKIDLILGQEEIIRRGFFYENMFGQRKLQLVLVKLRHSRKKGKFKVGSDFFRTIAEVMQISLVGEHLKKSGFAKGVERQIATDLSALFHIGLKGAIGETEITHQLQEAYENLSDHCDSGFKKDITPVYKVLRSIWASATNN